MATDTRPCCQGGNREWWGPWQTGEHSSIKGGVASHLLILAEAKMPCLQDGKNAMSSGQAAYWIFIQNLPIFKCWQQIKIVLKH